MSQYPNPQQPPYPQPPSGYPQMNYTSGQTPANPLALARRAAMLMFILGGLATAMALCMGAFAFLPIEQLATQQGQHLPALPPGITYRLFAIVSGIVFLVGGVSQWVVAFFVRRGTTAPLILGIILSSLFLINSLYSLTQAQNGASLIISLLAISAYSLLIYLLIQALRAVPYLKQVQAAYQAQYWRYVQQQQAYQNSNPMTGGSVYNQMAYNAPPAVSTQQAQSQTGWQWPAPSPPPPLSPPPPASQNPQNREGTYGQDPQQ